MDLLTAVEVSQLLRVPVSWIYARTSGSGERIPFLKLGRHLRFKRSEVIQWIERHHQNALVPSGCITEGEMQQTSVQ